METTKLSVLIVNYNSADFVEVSLHALKKLTKNPYQVFIRDNNSNKRDYLKLKRIVRSYKKVFLERHITKLKGSLAHSTALNDLVKKVKQTAQTIAKNQNLDKRAKDFEKRAKELEKFVNLKLKKLEPKLLDFVGGLKKNAEKYGVDLTDLEKVLKTQLKKVTTKGKSKAKASKSTKKTSTKSATTTKRATKKTAAAPTSTTDGQAMRRCLGVSRIHY